MNGFKDYLMHLEEQFKDRTAFVWYDEMQKALCQKTYGDYIADIFRCANYHRSICGDVRGKHLAFIAQNSYDLVVNLMAGFCAGAVVIPLNYMETKESLQYELEFADTEYLLANAESYALAHNAFSGKEASVFLLDAYHGFDAMAKWDMADDVEHVAALVMTSGTSGNVKCVMITEKNIMASLRYLLDYIQAVENALKDAPIKVMLTLPLYHIAGIATLLGYTYCGKSLNICSDLRNFIRDIALMPTNMTLVVPAILQAMAKMLVVGRQKESIMNLKALACGGAVVEPELAKLYDRYGIDLSVVYSMTECSGAGTYNMVNVSGKFGSIGQAGSGIEVSIQNGEICMKGDAVMSGYYKDSEETADTIIDGWLHTGDLGYMDEEGYLYITGRKKNLIILSGGENVSPEELEALLMKNADIKEALVKEKDGKICAEIFCDAEKRQEIRAFVTETNRGLPFYKRMTLVEFRSEPFEKTGSGKIKRNS